MLEEKIKIYIDFDGVIKETNSLIDDEFIRRFGSYSNYTNKEIIEKIGMLYWDNIINNSEIINESIEKIKRLMCDERYDVSILTHVCCSEEEIDNSLESRVKKEFCKEYIGDISIITCPKIIEKSDYVNPIGAILIDDFSENLLKWEEKGGIAIKFDSSEYNGYFATISDLDDIDGAIKDEITLIHMRMYDDYKYEDAVLAKRVRTLQKKQCYII